jgi:glycosyltransferase involved in cell wall biosynthesis
LRLDGYTAWLNRLALKLGIDSNIEWLGPLDACAIMNELISADAMLLPSYVENCSTTMQEAMMVGTPVVAAYTGGLSSLARDEVSALFFPAGDEALCASRLERVFTDRNLADSLSTNARNVAKLRNDPEKVTARQLEIYRQVIAGT